MNEKLKVVLLWLVVAVILITVFDNVAPKNGGRSTQSYSQFLNNVEQGKIASVTIRNQTIHGMTKSNQAFSTYMPLPDLYLIGTLVKNKVNVTGEPPQQESMLLRIFINWFPMLLLIGVWIFFMRNMQGGSGGGRGGPFSFGRSRAKLLSEDQIKVTFEDVAGCDEAKDDMAELVDFLKDPSKFEKLGGMIPRGVLMVGSPGTGKTLLAKAVAGEAKVPFFTISGSDFVEMFVGVGASRVRDMFEQAKKSAPCIIFIDEIDAVGRHRGAGVGGGHDEREQTLNQLLVEMDGFNGNEGVIIIAATNRPDVLDPALLRPGRFDRQIVVSLPDIQGREQILNVHLKKLPEMADDVISGVIARGTPGFSGADLANLVNEAALFAARTNRKQVSMLELEKAKDKIMMGAERKSMVMDEKEKKLTAYHEAGHAIVGLLMPEHDPVYKVTIIPRGRALGVTMFLPEQDRYSHTKCRLESQISTMFGGRIAEELIFGKDGVTTGASNDIERATDIARSMVTKWGLSDKLGPLTYGEDEGEVFLGRSMTKTKDVSAQTANLIDEEIRGFIDRNYARAEKLLKANLDKLHAMSDALMTYETIDSEQIADVMAGKTVREPVGWQVVAAVNDVNKENQSTEVAEASNESPKDADNKGVVGSDEKVVKKPVSNKAKSVAKKSTKPAKDDE